MVPSLTFSVRALLGEIRGTVVEFVRLDTAGKSNSSDW